MILMGQDLKNLFPTVIEECGALTLSKSKLTGNYLISGNPDKICKNLYVRPSVDIVNQCAAKDGASTLEISQAVHTKLSHSVPQLSQVKSEPLGNRDRHLLGLPPLHSKKGSNKKVSFQNKTRASYQNVTTSFKLQNMSCGKMLPNLISTPSHHRSRPTMQCTDNTKLKCPPSASNTRSFMISTKTFHGGKCDNISTHGVENGGIISHGVENDGGASFGADEVKLGDRVILVPITTKQLETGLTGER